MTWPHAELGIFIAGMAVIAYVVIRAWRHSARELAELQRLGTTDDYPVTRQPCPWCPLDAPDGATIGDCTCDEPCDEVWCKPLLEQGGSR